MGTCAHRVWSLTGDVLKTCRWCNPNVSDVGDNDECVMAHLHKYIELWAFTSIQIPNNVWLLDSIFHDNCLQQLQSILSGKFPDSLLEDLVEEADYTKCCKQVRRKKERKRFNILRNCFYPQIYFFFLSLLSMQWLFQSFSCPTVHIFHLQHYLLFSVDYFPPRCFHPLSPPEMFCVRTRWRRRRRTATIFSATNLAIKVCFCSCPGISESDIESVVGKAT